MVDPGPFPVRTEFPSLAPTQAPFAAPEPEGAGAEDLCGERCALWVTVGALAAVLLIGGKPSTLFSGFWLLDDSRPGRRTQRLSTLKVSQTF